MTSDFIYQHVTGFPSLAFDHFLDGSRKTNFTLSVSRARHYFIDRETSIKMTEENYPDVPKGTDIEEQVKPEETIDNKMEGGGDGGGRSSALYWLCVGLLLAGSIAGAIAGSIVLSRESEVSQLESACLASETSAGKDVCAKQSRALLSCQDVIHEAIAGLESEWTKNLKKGNTKDWAKALMKHISGVKYGMYYYDQADFCDGLVNWLKHNDGFVGTS